MRDVAYPASSPVSQCKDGFAAQIVLLFNKRAEDKPLIRRKDTGSKSLLLLDFHSTGGVPPEYLLLFNQPLAKLVDDRLDTRAVAHAIALFFERREVHLHCCRGQLSRLKVSPMPWTLG